MNIDDRISLLKLFSENKLSFGLSLDEVKSVDNYLKNDWKIDNTYWNSEDGFDTLHSSDLFDFFTELYGERSEAISEGQDTEELGKALPCLGHSRDLPQLHQCHSVSHTPTIFFWS